MELIYADDSGNDIGLLECDADFAYGSNENSFAVTVPIGRHCCADGYRIYAEHSEFGGIVDGIEVDTGEQSVTYKGRTWHGILATKVIEPAAGEDYRIMTGTLDSILGQVFALVGLTGLFSAETGSLSTSRTYQFDRYTDAYKALRKLGRQYGAKLSMYYDGTAGKVKAVFKAVTDYSQSEEWDSSQMRFRVQKVSRFANHLVCLGSGELSERMVRHLYADSSGAISETQSLTGLDEVTEVYDYPNTESEDELVAGGITRLEELIQVETLDAVSFETEDEEYDVGDIVGARENITGIFVTKEISKKILRIEDGESSISYEIGG